MKSNKFHFKGASGKFGKFMVKARGGQNIIFTRAQPLPRKERAKLSFKEASQYAVEALKDPQNVAMYELGIKRKNMSAYHVALEDFLNPPTVHEVDLSHYGGNVGDKILIKASDDFLVKDVTLRIVDKRTVIESGIAFQDHADSDSYAYACQCENKNYLLAEVIIHVSDYAGNVTECQLFISE